MSEDIQRIVTALVGAPIAIALAYTGGASFAVAVALVGLVGQMELYRFVNPAGMKAIGENLFKVTNASGEAIGGRPGLDGMGKTIHKFLEKSNVSVVQEMVSMITAQRAYELNSKAIQTSDTMLGIANNLKR